jgi:hypothetical protein
MPLKDEKKLMNFTKTCDYVILARDLNTKVGNTPINKAPGKFGELTTNTNGNKLIDLTVYSNLRIMNIFYDKPSGFIRVGNFLTS